MEAVVNFLEKVDPERAEKAKQRYSCFDKCTPGQPCPAPFCNAEHDPRMMTFAHTSHKK
jgi:hypothetical protein